MRLSSNTLNFLHSFCFNIIYALQGVQRPPPCDTLGFPPPSHSALFFSISTLHTSSGLSVAQGLSLVSTCVQAPRLRAFIWFQYLNFPPVCLSAISCIHSFGFKTSPLVSEQASPVSQQLLAFIWFQYLTSPPVPLTSFLNFLHSLGFNIYTSSVASPQLLAFILF